MISLNPFSWWNVFRETESDKVVVDNESMLGSAAIWFAINTIAGDVAKMPLDKMKSDGGKSKMKDSGHQAGQLLRTMPNYFQTADVFKEQIQAHALSWGNGRSAIVRDLSGRPTELIPLMPDRTVTLLHEGRKYHFTNPLKSDPINSSDYREALVEVLREGMTEKWIALDDADVLHIQGFGYDGYCGFSLAKVARDSIGCDLRSQKYTDKQLKKGFAGKLMLEAPANVMKNEDEAKQFLDGFRKKFTNDLDGETIGMLREGIKANVMQMSNVDSQFIEQRRFSRQDVMLWFGLQHIPGDNSSVSYNSLEQKQLAYLASCLDRWLVRWEMQCNAKLLTEAERKNGRHYFKFNRATWLRTDIQTTANTLSNLLRSKIINRNEARETLDYNPVDGGDVFENPAIATNTGENEPGETPDESGTGNDDRAKAVIRNRLNELLAVESKRVDDKLGKQNPMKSIESFYAKWVETLGDAVESMGFARDIAQKHCENRQNSLLSTGKWGEIETILDELLAEMYPN